VTSPAGTPRACGAGTCPAPAEAMGTWANGQSSPVCGLHAAALRARGLPVVGLTDRKTRAFADASALTNSTLRVERLDDGRLWLAVEDAFGFRDIMLAPEDLASLREFLA